MPVSKELTDVTVIKNARDFADLEEEWEELYEDSPLATPFQTWGWLYSWWEFYGEGSELRLITIRAHGRLIGLIPLMLQPRGKLLFIGTRTTDYLDVLARRGWETEVSETVVKTLQGLDSWWVADLWDVRPSGVAWNVFRGWHGPKTSHQLFGCPTTEVKPWRELLKDLSRTRRKSALASSRRAEADGVQFKLAGEDRVTEAARRLVALHRETWEGRPIGPEHLTRRFESHFEAAARRMTARGHGAIYEWWRGGKVIGSELYVFGKDFVEVVLMGYSKEARDRYQVSSLVFKRGLTLASERNIGYFNTGRGEEAYKLPWATRIEPNYRLILGRNLAAWAPYVAYHLARFRFTQYETSEDSPEWLKRATRIVGRLKRRGR